MGLGNPKEVKNFLFETFKPNKESMNAARKKPTDNNPSNNNTTTKSIQAATEFLNVIRKDVQKTSSYYIKLLESSETEEKIRKIYEANPFSEYRKQCTYILSFGDMKKCYSYYILQALQILGVVFSSNTDNEYFEKSKTQFLDDISITLEQSKSLERTGIASLIEIIGNERINPINLKITPAKYVADTESKNYVCLYSGNKLDLEDKDQRQFFVIDIANSRTKNNFHDSHSNGNTNGDSLPLLPISKCKDANFPEYHYAQLVVYVIHSAFAHYIVTHNLRQFIASLPGISEKKTVDERVELFMNNFISPDYLSGNFIDVFINRIHTRRRIISIMLNVDFPE